MGASASLILPHRITRDEFKYWGGNVYSDYFHNKLKGEDDCIDRSNFSNFALSIVDVYMCHDRGSDSLGRDTQERVKSIKRALEERGLICKLNEDNAVATDIKSVLEENVRFSRVICMFITKEYRQRVRGKGASSDRDSCRYEFLHAAKVKGPASMIAVVLDPEVASFDTWLRPLMDQLAGRPCVDMSAPNLGEGDSFEAAIDEVEAAVLSVIGCPVKKSIDNLIAELCPVSLTFDDELVDGATVSHLPFDHHEVTLTGHMLGVRCMLAHEDYVFTAGADFKVHIWDVLAWHIIGTLNHGAAITSMAITPCGKRLFTGSSNRSLKVWNLADRSLVTTLSGRAPLSLVVTNDTILGGHSKCLKVWSIDTLAEQHSYTGREGSVYCMAIAGTKVFTGATGGDIRLLDLSHHLAPAATLSGHTAIVNDLCLRGRRLFSASADCTIRVWDVLTLTFIDALFGHSGPVFKLLMHGGLMYSSSADCTVRVWDINQLAEVAVLTGHTDQVRCMTVAGGRLWTGSDDYTVKLWRSSSTNYPNSDSQTDEECKEDIADTKQLALNCDDDNGGYFDNPD